MKTTLALALIAGALAQPALAGTWTAPEGCEVFMTVQSKGCRVSNYYTCTQDAAGEQWRADFDQEGLFFRSRINAEGEWIESLEQNPPVRQTLDPGAEDPASFSELLASGVDTYAFSLSRDDGGHSNVIGVDRLTGRTRVIDGQTLEETEFDYSETDDFGTVLRRARGNEYISRDKRLFFAGPGETDLGDGQWLPIDGSPVDFTFPGDKGFASTQPIYDCDALTADAGLPQSVWRAGYGG
ncbi:hypothetical protein [Fuscovulum blasticum]|uniref:hypothetical protein n=1 Tax=Fuscovulum blasticum TaxID=1075 RepID=UPI000D3E365E|nr:hypothetical protein [Fuscovulum blasticum]AWD22282.1 hypothetical protein B6K69_11835 [Fuscovulum blasticum]